MKGEQKCFGFVREEVDAMGWILIS